jgi:hypothetical protein
MYWKLICLVSCVLALGAANTAFAAAPANDDCQNATPVVDVNDLPFDTTEATFDGPGFFIQEGPNVWYCYTASCDGCATVSLQGSSFDTKLAAYYGCSCDLKMGNLIGGNNDFRGIQSKFTFPVLAGHKYLIEVGGVDHFHAGKGFITITCDKNASSPSNDRCNWARHIGDVTDMLFDTLCATFDGPGHCMDSPNVWYRYTAAVTGDVTVRIEAIDDPFDTILAVYDGADCEPTEDALIECNDDFGNSLDSQITFLGIAGNEYLIEVGGLNEDDIGQGTISVSSGAPPVSFNDDCQNAMSVGDVKALAFDTTDATFDGTGLCMISPNIWYCYTAPCTGRATISLCGSSFDTMLAVYDGCDCNPGQGDMIACNDDACDTQSEVTIDVVAGKQYLIEVGGYGSETGQGVLAISTSCEADVASDLGDAPDSSNNFSKAMTAYPSVQANYPTVFDDGTFPLVPVPLGPVHVNASPVAYLGSKISGESEADTGPDEDGDNNIDPQKDAADNDGRDDGVAMPLNLPNCQWVTFDYEVNVFDPQTDLWVNVWFDWNRDGDWDDAPACDAGSAPEWAVQNQFIFGLPVGLHQITTPAFLPWHPKSGPEEIWMRITLSEKPWKGGTGNNPAQTGNGGSGPGNKYQIGETEDYLFTPEKIGIGDCPLCQDVNGDGVIDMKDLTDLTALWLEKCL